MAAFALAVPLSSTSSIPIRCSSQKVGNSSKNNQNVIRSGRGAIGNVMEVVKKDMNFIKEGFGKGVEWANKTFRIPQVAKKVDDVVWLRNLENPEAVFPSQAPSWPQPHYSDLSGLDLFMADLKALETYFNYFYYLSLMWTKPLPEIYDPQEVAMYFNLRPHIVVLRLLEVFLAFASAAIKIRMSGISSTMGKEVEKNILQYNFGMILKETMLNLGPTFIKIGQSLSTRPDIIGSEISKALSGLHEQIPPFPRTLALKIIEEELGSPVDKVFTYISSEPVAAASFGQVYRGRTHDGCDVAVKVQRPNLRHVVVRDIYILRLGLGVLRKIAKRKSDPRFYADELGRGFVGELDYTLEATNAEEFREAHSPYPFIMVPKVLRHLTQKRVLTMEWMAGESPRDLLFLSTESVGVPFGHEEKRKYEAKRKLLDMVNKGVEASLIQLLDTGLLHADPHPGNLRYISSRQIGFLDFGLLCRMEKKHQFAMLASIVHIVYGDWASLVKAMIEMDVVRPGTNLRQVTMVILNMLGLKLAHFCETIIQDLEYSLGEVEFHNGIPNIKFSRVLGKIWSVALKYHFRMPPYYTLVLRSLASLEGLAVAADPNFRTFEAAYPYVVRKLLTENSASSRRILHSVVLNRRREFQWQKLAFFLKVGAVRKGLHLVAPSSPQSSSGPSSNGVAGVYDIANLILRVLPSEDGIVLRKLIMTADGSSLIRAIVSREARSFRQQFSVVIADVFYLWILRTLAKVVEVSRLCSPQLQLPSGTRILWPDSFSRLQTIDDYQSFLKDRRIKVIIFNILNSARKDLALMARFYWTSFVMLVTASVLAFSRMLATIFEASIARVSSSIPKKIAVGV